MTVEAPKLEEYCQDSFRSLEEDSVVFQKKDQLKSVATVDLNSVKFKGIMGKGAFANIKSATVDRLPGRRNSSFSRGLFGSKRGILSNSCKKYAIKSLRESLRASMVFDGAADLAKEAMFLGTIRHPNIIYLHGAGENLGKSWLWLVADSPYSTSYSRCAFVFSSTSISL